MSPQNLTNVYNQNPTLQSSYTLQQYLDLFGGSSTPATTTTATTTTPTTTPTTATASQGIINQNINQYQNQGGGDGPQGGGKFGNLDMDTAKEFSIDGKTVTGYKNQGSGLYQDLDGLNIQNLGIGSFGVVGLIEKALGLDKNDPKYAGLFDKVSYKALIKNPYLAKSFFARQDKKKQDDLQKKIDADNKKAAQDAKNARDLATIQARVARGDSLSNIGKDMYTGPGMAFEAGNTPSGGGFTGGKETDTSPGGYNSPRRDGGLMGKDGSRRIEYNDGGSTNGSGEKAFSAKVKELMDDGYEFGEAVKEAMKQGYMNGGRVRSYFKGGLVSLRGK